MSEENTPSDSVANLTPTVPPNVMAEGVSNIQTSYDAFTSRIVGIKFRSVGKVYDFDAKDFKFIRGDHVVCDFEDKGTMLGQVSKPTITIPPEVLKLKVT
jgi:hypothetical protein